MKSGTVDVSVPDGFEKTVSTTAGELEDQVRLMAALKMFELGKLSSIHEGFRDTSSLAQGAECARMRSVPRGKERKARSDPLVRTTLWYSIHTTLEIQS